MHRLQGRNAILTESSHGVGPHFARALAREGVNLTLVARSAERLEPLVKEIRGIGVQTVAIPVDIANPVAREAILSHARAAFGEIDILINNASVHDCGGIHMRTINDVDEIIQTNLVASILLTRAVLPSMLKRGEGHLVHCTSLAGRLGIPYVAAYSATQHGLIGFNRALQAELKDTGVRSTAVFWGDTPITGRWDSSAHAIGRRFSFTSTERRAQALVRAIKHNRVQRIVSPLRESPIIMLASLAPRLTLKALALVREDQFMHGDTVRTDVEIS